MEWITCGDALSVGDERIDSEHRKLAAIINKLADGVMHPAPALSYRKLLADLVEFAQAHFAEEDRLMLVHRYPEAEQHQAEHRSLIQSVLDQMAEPEIDASPSVHLPRFLRRWLTAHIATMDRDLLAFLASGG